MTLPKRLADAIQRAVERAIEQRSSTWMMAKVTATYTDGTSDISTARGPIQKVRRLKSYASPAVNDLVKVDRNADGNWVIVGAFATV